MGKPIDSGRRSGGNLGARMTLGLVVALLAWAVTPGMAASSAKPDFGPNVLIFAPSMPAAMIQKQVDKVYAIQRRNEFGPERNALMFLPGKYNVDVPIGFYTEVIGLGASPNDVQINGNLHSDASEDNNNATTTFWRAAEGLTMIRGPCDGQFRQPHLFAACAFEATSYCITSWMGERWLDVRRSD